MEGTVLGTAAYMARNRRRGPGAISLGRAGDRHRPGRQFLRGRGGQRSGTEVPAPAGREPGIPGGQAGLLGVGIRGALPPLTPRCLWNSTCSGKVMAKQVFLERNWCSELVSVVRVNRSGNSESVPGNLEEIGERSALVLTECPVPVASRVHIACRTHVLRGVTKSFEFDPLLGYFIEIELAPASRWSRRWFSPRHLVPVHEHQVRLSA